MIENVPKIGRRQLLATLAGGAAAESDIPIQSKPEPIVY